MNYDPAVCQKQVDFNEDLAYDVVNTEDLVKSNHTNKFKQSPHLLCAVMGFDTYALIDTGSQVTAISESFYDKIKKHVKIRELPVANISVITAIGKKATCIKKTNFY